MKTNLSRLSNNYTITVYQFFTSIGETVIGCSSSLNEVPLRS